MSTQVLDPCHERWNEFLDKLHRTTCKKDRRNAINILEEMGNIDLDGTIEVFEKFGAFCDCQIKRRMHRGTKEMNPFHPRWKQFLSELKSKKCKKDMRNTIIILYEMGHVDIDITLDYSLKTYGRCDCEILLNADGVHFDALVQDVPHIYVTHEEHEANEYHEEPVKYDEHDECESNEEHVAS